MTTACRDQITPHRTSASQRSIQEEESDVHVQDGDEVRGCIERVVRVSDAVRASRYEQTPAPGLVAGPNNAGPIKRGTLPGYDVQDKHMGAPPT